MPVVETAANKPSVGDHSIADHVFADDYKLMSISDMENYIKIHKHLPNVPAAQELVNDGIDLAKMDAKLLEKIEELSLYVIEQNKKIAEQDKKIELLQKAIWSKQAK